MRFGALLANSKTKLRTSAIEMRSFVFFVLLDPLLRDIAKGKASSALFI